MEIEDVYTQQPDSEPVELDPPTSDLVDPPYYFIPVIPSDQEGAPASSPSSVDLEDWTLDGIETFALSPVTSATGLKGVLLDILGPYDNIITQYRYQANSNGNYTYVHETTPDYPWIASAVLFIVLLYSVFQCFRRALWPR